MSRRTIFVMAQPSSLCNVLVYRLHGVLRNGGVLHVCATRNAFPSCSRGNGALFPRQHLATWVFGVELLLLAKALHIPVAEVLVTWREVPGSKPCVVRDFL